jgi:hypothetical protein
MELDWRHRLALQMLASGNTLGEAATASGVHRQSLLRWRWESPDFAQAVTAAREAGGDERRYRAWLHTPSVVVARPRARDTAGRGPQGWCHLADAGIGEIAGDGFVR